MTTDTTLTSELTIQQVSRHTGLAESALRYYERIGLIDAVPRDASSGHRRYPADLVATIESLSCLRGSGMSVADIRTYVANTKRGDDATSDQRRLFEAHAARLHDEITRLRMRERYITAKARMWAARERGDTEAEQEIISTVIELGGRLLNGEGAQRG
ncbi:MAG: MerR family transcriptional regulator, aldehyde-responsive regulator [Mycobacterium sp.]|jgi:DNA-binding transcriptional MerR regulator|nr:MerR family transcriptional regulator, aldehyde-responsive regulator [Mycobacterium sp.]MDT5301901.1 MerR family transcriptional regulator, aldehyde-responsive regulator [Mycobacterium sp.]